MKPLLNNKSVYLINSKIGNRHAWYYILVGSIKKPLLINKVGKESLDLKNYGEILFSGWGKEPPKEIQEKLNAYTA